MDDEGRRGAEGPPPLVTVVLGSYQHVRFLPRALAAVAAQTYPNIELVVSDDASTDGSAELIAAWLAEHRPDARFIRHEVNVGLCRAINATLEAATGEYITLTSADDWMEPQRIETLVEVFERSSPAVGLVWSAMRVVDGEGREIGRMHDRPDSDLNGWVFPQLLRKPQIPSPTVMLRRSIYDEVGTYDEGDTVDDYDMCLRICRRYEVRHVPEVLVSYTLHGENMSAKIDERRYRAYQATCLRRHLGFSPETDAIIHGRLAFLAAADELYP